MSIENHGQPAMFTLRRNAMRCGTGVERYRNGASTPL